MVRGGLPELTPLQGCEVERDGACKDLGDGCEVERDGVCEDLGDEPSGLKGQAALRRSGVFPRPRGQGGGEWQGGSRRTHSSRGVADSEGTVNRRRGGTAIALEAAQLCWRAEESSSALVER